MQHLVFCLFQESLRKITHTLALKNEEISNFVCTLKQSLDNLEVQTQTGMNFSVIRFFLIPLLVYFPCSLTFLLRHQANSNRVQADLESEFTSLHSILDEMKESMLTRIKQERASRTYELQVRLWVCGLSV